MKQFPIKIFLDTIKELNETEMYCIKKLNSFVPNGYNITKGGNGDDIFTK
jgi:hypothetical protein